MSSAPSFSEDIRFRMTPTERRLKRAFDVIFALVGIATIWPLMVLLCIILFIGGGRHVFYQQERQGLGGRVFNILKFRTMKVNAEVDVPRLERPGDPRLTRIGAVLRRHHLDELPQLWNVLRGDMSVVGPRPERPYFVRLITERDPRYPALFQIRPGLTSEATLVNGYTDNIEKMTRRLEFDLDYLQHATLGGDIRLILRTIRVVICGDKRPTKLPK